MSPPVASPTPMPDAARRLHAQGLERVGFGDLEGARQLFSQALAAGGGAESHCQLGICLRTLGQNAEAEAEFRAALAESPSLMQAWFGLIFMLRETGRRLAAQEQLNLMAEQYAGNLDVLHKIGGLMGDLSFYKEASTIYESILKAEPEARNYQRIGQYYQKLGRYEDADVAFLAAIDGNPNLGSAYLLMANNHRFGTDAGDVATRTRFEAALQSRGLTPDTEANIHFALGKINDDQARYDIAFHHFERGNRLRSKADSFDAQQWLIFARDLRRRQEAYPDRVSPLAKGAATPLFVVGMPRSGTTLVERILGSHPKVRGMGETRWIAELVGQVTARTGADFPQFLDLLSETQFGELRAAYLRRWPERDQDTTYMVDKNPLNFIYLGLIARMFPSARIVHVRREPRDTCVSVYFQNFANTTANSYAYDLQDIGHFYKGYQEVMQHWQKVLPEGMLHEVSYETLVANQEHETRRLVKALGLPWDKACLDFQDLPDDISTASVWQARQPLYDLAIDRWRHYEQHIQPLLDVLAAR